MEEMLTVAGRYIIISSLFFLPRSRRILMERWLRGREEYHKLRQADWVLVSWGKSGRTWFRVMLSRFYQLRHGLPQRMLLEFDNLHRRNPAIPKVLFTHNNYLRDYLQDRVTLNHFREKKMVFLARDPRDVAVSQYFQWKYRMRPHKKRLNDYPPHGADVSLFNFVTDAKVGLPRIIEFLNGWAEFLAEPDNAVLMIRYEDMRMQPEATLKRVLKFAGTPGTDEEIREAVEFAAYENMKRLELKKTFWPSGARVRPGDAGNPDSFKVRRAKVGGFRDYFDEEQTAVIDRLLTENLNPIFGYHTRGLREESNAAHDDP